MPSSSTIDVGIFDIGIFDVGIFPMTPMKNRFGQASIRRGVDILLAL